MAAKPVKAQAAKKTSAPKKSAAGSSKPAPRSSRGTGPSAGELQMTHDLMNRVSSAVMVVNTDFIVQYVNQGTLELFARHAESFRKLWPDFDPSQIIGTCIDRFHKVPAHQRQLLANPRNLPMKTDITVGNAKIQLHVTPITDGTGRPSGFSLEWSDVTALRDSSGQLAAINKSQAVIEFSLEGTILTANENFLSAVGYTADEIHGKHHSMLVDPIYANSAEYRQFWAELKGGQYQAGQYRRIGKGGREIWIQASYNPICDLNGRPFKVVKFATDITSAKQMEAEIANRQKQDARAAEELSAKVAQVLDVVNAVADGNFDITVPSLGDDAVGQVATALSTAINSMKTALQAVREVAATVSNAASEMTSASTEISKGAQHQASSLEETASSLEEITSTVKQNTDNAQQARQLANGSRDVAEKGGAVLNDAIRAMGEINQSSTKIADIITTIDEIAFQTNLLALNAAVEAARAGEQGRGFAVVAAEVRNLSQRSALAAKEIKSLIQDSVRKVENGTSLVNQSGKTLEEIVGSVKRVTDIVAEIAAASKEQLTGIEQVNKAVAQMDRVTQNNASQTEEMAGTAESLLNHSEQLTELVARFRLESGETASPPAGGRRNDASAKRRPKSLETNLDKVVNQLHQTAGAGFREF
jgi:methyl-accepting chemotaxis protein